MDGRSTSAASNRHRERAVANSGADGDARTRALGALGSLPEAPGHLEAFARAGRAGDAPAAPGRHPEGRGRAARQPLTGEVLLRCEQLDRVVWLPPGVNRNLWIAKKTLGLWNEVRLLVGLVTANNDCCTAERCPAMSAGRSTVYEWPDADDHCIVPMTIDSEDEDPPRQDGREQATAGSRPPAPVYMERVVERVRRLLSDRQLIPEDGRRFPENFLPAMQEVQQLLFHCFAHVYRHHLDFIRAQDLEAEVNVSFRHWLLFVREFNLMSDAEMAPLRHHIQAFLQAFVPSEPDWGDYPWERVVAVLEQQL